MDDLGEDDARYIHRVIAVQRGLEAGGRGLLQFSLLPPAWAAGTTALSVSRILENIVVEDLTTETTGHRWPRFTAGAADAGFRAAHALPMRLRGEVIGVLNLLHTDRHTLTGPDARLGQALADAATIGLLHERAVRRAETAAEQLQGALNSRVMIEQAKGVLATQGSMSPDNAFTVLRNHARGHGLRLTDLARQVVDRTVDLTTIVRPAL
jgi:GAF domain-containing protein